jgi:hypothetical protein
MFRQGIASRPRDVDVDRGTDCAPFEVMKNILYRLLMVSLFSVQAPAADQHASRLDGVLQKSLVFLSQAQFSADAGFYVSGEWPVQMKSYLIPSLVGLGRPLALPSEEPTAFATASILNLLSEAYLLDSDLRSVPEIINRALPSFSRYRENELFYYYPMTDFKTLRLHVPLDPHYVPRKMMSLALVPPDADTTSVGFTSLAFADLILKKKPISEFEVPTETLSTLDKYRDLNRLPHPYNRLNGGVKNSGAYMTWLWDENAPSSSFFKSINDNPRKGYRIVFGRNDVDCVVNANVLRLLALTKNENEPGFKNSCQFLNDSILRSRDMQTQAKYCGLYYPNTFGAIYSISNAYKAGATCLSQSRAQALKLILERQNQDGSWSNDPGIGRTDQVQTTASALNALLNYVDADDRSYVDVVRRGAEFLISQSKNKDQNRAFWTGEVFFSAGPAARNSILWRSDAYTTALAVLSLTKAKVYLKDEVLP